MIRMSLWIVGIGLIPGDITLRGMERIRRADRVFLDSYTSVQAEAGLEGAVGRPIEILDRASVESDMLVELAAREDVCLLVPGDGLTATTHLTLLIECLSHGIEAGVVPGISVATVVPGVLGLQWYKFGRATTVPFSREGYRPESPHAVVVSNLGQGLHTLVLLDIDDGRMMTAAEGLRYLLEIDARVGAGVIGSDTLVAAVARAGAGDQRAVSGRLEAVVAADIGPPPHTVVVPGDLHFMEEEALRRIRIDQSPVPAGGR